MESFYHLNCDRRSRAKTFFSEKGQFFQSGHKAKHCLQRGCFTATIMGFSRSIIKEEIQSSKYDHRISRLLTSGQREGNKTRPRSYWLRQQCLVCLCWTPHYRAHDDTQGKNHFWPTWTVTRLHPATHQTGKGLLLFLFFSPLQILKSNFFKAFQ